MIKILFPPGCYGTFLARCIYNFSNLRQGEFQDFTFTDGSSHVYRSNQHANELIRVGHSTTLTIDDQDQVVTIVPSQDHALDYYNNQFYKEDSGHLVSYILKQISPAEAQEKLQTQWGYLGTFDTTVPRWIMREWCSFWIQDILDAWYSADDYVKINALRQTTTQDLFENFLPTLETIFIDLGLTFTVDRDIVDRQHQGFVKAQKFHNSEIKCRQIVSNVLSGVDAEVKIHSIFDEAYIQHLLRKNDLDLMCEGLDSFPISTAQLKKLTYETSNNCNPR